MNCQVFFFKKTQEKRENASRKVQDEVKKIAKEKHPTSHRLRGENQRPNREKCELELGLASALGEFFPHLELHTTSS